MMENGRLRPSVFFGFALPRAGEGQGRGRISVQSSSASLNVTHANNDKPQAPIRQLRLELIVDPSLQRRARQRRIDADPPACRIGLVRPDDPVVVCRAVLRFEPHPRAEIDRVRIARRPVDDAKRREPLRQVAHAPVDLAELLLAVDVLGVLRAIAFGRGIGKRAHDLRTAHAPEHVELVLEAALTVGRDDRGRRRGGGSPAAHTCMRAKEIRATLARARARVNGARR